VSAVFFTDLTRVSRSFTQRSPDLAPGTKLSVGTLGVSSTALRNRRLGFRVWMVTGGVPSTAASAVRAQCLSSELE